ncbi:VOC family protein [Guptibacillus hwajinpoensis]|uniref:VOC family protein n=1 Tax=Guptibacillus hwajinpoensis TaxID=208199 RepID=UPI001CFE315A|nr:VOC family protein [Pseudalkalibacillus hwajinpoensis]
MSIDYIRLHHVQICIPKGTETTARDFYINVLNFVEIEKPKALKKNGGFWLRAADIELHVGTEDSIVPGKRHPAFEIQNLNDAKTQLEKHNISIQEETPIEGFERFSFRDPFQNRIEFITRIEMPGL